VKSGHETSLGTKERADRQSPHSRIDMPHGEQCALDRRRRRRFRAPFAADGEAKPNLLVATRELLARLHEPLKDAL